MNFLALVISVVFLAVLLAAAFWIGIYVVLPLILLFCVVSAVASLIRVFLPKSAPVRRHTSIQHQVIDVEFEEIK